MCSKSLLCCGHNGLMTIDSLLSVPHSIRNWAAIINIYRTSMANLCFVFIQNSLTGVAHLSGVMIHSLRCMQAPWLLVNHKYTAWGTEVLRHKHIASPSTSTLAFALAYKAESASGPLCSAGRGGGQQGLDLKGAGVAQTQASPKLIQLPLCEISPFSCPSLPAFVLHSRNTFSVSSSSSLPSKYLHLPFSSVETVLSMIQTGDKEGSVALANLCTERLPITPIICNHKGLTSSQVTRRTKMEGGFC